MPKSGQAEPATAITSDGTLGTHVTVNGDIHAITGGARPSDGPNLFHSFAEFTLGTNHTAKFVNESKLPTTNIFSRVTGGNPSEIFGIIDTKDFGAANLFLLNPAGILFGPEAQLHLGGSFHVTTADYIRFTDDTRFTAVPGQADAVLSVAPVEAFGFLSESPAGLTVDHSALELSNGQTLSMIGGTIDVIGRGIPEDGSFPASFGGVFIEEGTLSLVSVSSPGEAVQQETGVGPFDDTSTFRSLGELSISEGVLVDVSGNGGGTVAIHGGRLVMTKSFIFADNKGDADAARPGIDIHVDQELIVRDGLVTTDVFGQGQGADILIEAGSLVLERTSDLVLTGFVERSRIGSLSNPFRTRGSFGDSGNLQVTVQDGLTILGTAEMSTSNGPGTSGSGGSITISAGNVMISGTLEDPNDFTGIFSNNLGSGDGGNLSLTAQNAELRNQASLQVSTRGSGNAGQLAIDLGQGQLSLKSGSFLLVDTNSEGDAGGLLFKGGDLIIEGFANSSTPSARGIFTGIDSSSEGPGHGADIDIRAAGNVILTANGIIRANSTSTGNAGTITVRAGSIIRLDQAMITTEAERAFGGTIKLDAGDLIHVINSQVTSRVLEGSADAGGIDFDARFIIVQHSLIDTSNAGTGGGDGGPVTFSALQAILIDSLSLIDTSSQFGGTGIVDIQAPIRNLSGTLAPLPQTPRSLAAMYASRCAAQKGGQFSSFVHSSIGGLPPSPGGWLPSPLPFIRAGKMQAVARAPDSHALPTRRFLPATETDHHNLLFGRRSFDTLSSLGCS